MKNKSVNCQFVHHAKFHCIMTTLNKVFKNEFEKVGNWKRARKTNIKLGILKGGTGKKPHFSLHF